MPFLLVGNPIILIIMPLVNLAKQQVSKLKAAGLSAIYVSDIEQVESIIDENFTYVFISPELVKHRLISLLSAISPTAKERFTHVFVDESHCVVKW